MGQHTSSLLSQSLPPKSRFTEDDIPDLTGRVAIVTGGNTGIGKETVRALLSHNATVYLAARSESKAKEAIRDLSIKTGGKEAIFLELDLAELASVKRAVKVFSSRETELHMLFNNGGVMWPDVSLLTKDGYDLQWGTNVIGHYLLTKLLIPSLQEGAKSSPDKHARVVFTSSSAAYFDTIHWDTFKPSQERDKLGTYGLYAQSKHGNVVIANEFARRYAKDGIVTTSCNPGNLKSDLQRHLNPISHFLLNLILYPVQYGALTQLWAATSPDTVDLNGKFLIPWARVGECRAEAYDPEVGRRLWEYLEEETKVQQE
ncbi:NAD-P-binding protein [Stereum hirsutum FP-91666 SS1]|uniref:NAD-P-binding protein n=1 Tax=Stereum hirsutum (strain FP-91666) TaxID=721885 RepID=UPI000440E368|nr:NAD-P-binding protein [Stereum hirsutum FP-91666 SS1]EIM88722.1 NAD-P-binding protein [Stereum hirsutum FP-91666 SS1]